MSVETYKYFQPDTDLRAEFGGSLIQSGTSPEIKAEDLTHRYVLKKLGFPKDKTDFILQEGLVSGAVWYQVSDPVYTALSSHLTATELASVVSAPPAGFSLNANKPAFTSRSGLKNLHVIGDSLSRGWLASGALNDSPCVQAINGMAGETLVEDTTQEADRVWQSENWAVFNNAVAGSSFANTRAAGGTAVYPERLDLSFNQRHRTIPLSGTAENYIHIWLGTNDLAYEPLATGAYVWARTEALIGQLKIEHPTTPIIVGTCIRRGENASLNDRIDDFNTLMRANYVSAGADYLVDYETAHASFNSNTGDTTDTSQYNADGVHLNTAGYGSIGGALQSVLESVVYVASVVTKPFSLAGWKIQLPINASGGLTGTYTEITQPELDLYNSAYFMQGSSYTFVCPDGGATTGGSTHPRTELRHEFDFAWNDITEMKMEFSVPRIGDGERTYVMQNHGISIVDMKIGYTGGANGTSIFKIFYRSTESSSDTSVLLKSNITEGDKSKIRIRRSSTELQVFLDGNVDGTIPDWSSNDAGEVPFTRDGSLPNYYWKMGNYYQEEITPYDGDPTCMVVLYAETWDAPVVI